MGTSRHMDDFATNQALGPHKKIAVFRGNLELDVVLPEMKRFEDDTALGSFVEDALDNIRVAKSRHTQLGVDRTG